MKIFCLGYGNMGQAIAKSLKQFGGYHVYISDHSAKKLALGKKQFNFTVDKELEFLPNADVVLIAVKPQNIIELAKDVKGRLKPGAILASIAAGVTISKIQRLFGHDAVVRIMPNMGVLVNEGVAAWVKTKGMTYKQIQIIVKFLSSFSKHFEVKNESLLDAVTAISGSGPAYFFLFADSLSKAGESLGLNRQQSLMLVRQTFQAAAKLQQSQPYLDLIGKVASKKGTTEAALKVFKKYKLDNTVKFAAMAAYERAKELSNE